MNLLMRLTHNSLATIIAWVSTCLLAGGVSTLFSESARTMWMSWGCFGLVAAVGLDVAARVRERMRMDELNLIANRRFERDINYETEENEAKAAIREAVARMLVRTPQELQIAASRRTQDRNPCDLAVELLLQQGHKGAAGNRRDCRRIARITNLTESGFELTLMEPLSRQRLKLIIAAANGGRQTMLGEVLWCGPQRDGSIVAGGRFLDVVSADGD